MKYCLTGQSFETVDELFAASEVISMGSGKELRMRFSRMDGATPEMNCDQWRVF
jgi:hypothetical protein